MKNRFITRWGFGGVLSLGLILAGYTFAQNKIQIADSTAVSEISEGGVVTLDPNEDVSALTDFEVEIKAVQAMPTISATNLPEAGTFYSAQHLENSAEPWPPLPTHGDFPAWSLGDGFFMLDDRAFDYSVTLKPVSSAKGGMMMAAGIPDFPPDDGGDTNSGGNGNYTSQVSFPTNVLWLEITGTTNGVAYLTLHNTTNGVLYEILSKQELTNAEWLSEGVVLGADSQDWTATTVWEGLRTNYLFFRARSWMDSDGSGLPDWWQLQNFGHTGVDPYADADGDGWNNLQEFQNGTNPNQFNTPPPPRNVVAQLDATGTNVVLTWQSGGGPVTAYGIWNDSYVEVTQVGSNTFSQTIPVPENPEEIPYGYISGDVFNEPTYQIRAYYTNGTYLDSASVTVTKPNLSLNVQLVRGPQGQLYLAVSAPPPDLAKFRLVWMTPNYYTGLYDYQWFDLPASNLVNGVMVVPTNTYLPYIWDPSGMEWWTYVKLEVFSTNGSLGYSYGAPQVAPERTFIAPVFGFVDARSNLTANLKFLLRSATVSTPFSYQSFFMEGGGINSMPGTDPQYYLGRPASPTNYEYYGYHYYSPYLGGAFMDELRPVRENFLWRNFTFNTADLTNGVFQTGAHFFVGYDATLTLDATAKYQYAGTGAENPLPLVLAANNYTWALDRYMYTSNMLGDLGLGVDANNHLVLGGNVQNVYGLSIPSVHFRDIAGQYQTLTAGNTFPYFYSGNYFFEAATPNLQTAGYYFASGTPLPGSPAFSVTNTSPLLIAPFGQLYTVSGWAKQQINNGYSGKYGYLEQYFDKAYTIGPNGVATTNSAGLLSPYGEFFPMQPGPAALVTLPDIDTGARGTGVVQVVKLQLDANHDGVMDLSFTGPDNTSSARPFRFWVNNDSDITPLSGAGSGDEQTPAYFPDYQSGWISSQRDLEDFARLWICGLPALAANQGYTVTLSLAAQSGNPAINLVDTVETNGGTGYLTDTNIAIAELQRAAGKMSPVTYPTISPTTPLNLPANLFTNAGNKYFLFEGSGIGSGVLTLTISRTNALGTNVLAQTSAWLDLHDVKEMYQRVKAIPRDPSGIAAPFNATSTFDETTADVDTSNDGFAFTPPGDEANTAVVFVHGSNLSLINAISHGETMFKRLYWQGYSGRFVLFYWNTLVGPWDGTIPAHYNYNEYRAFKYGLALKKYVSTGLPTNYVKNVIGHSMGNMVVASALYPRGGTPGMTCRNVIFMQAAVPASCLNSNASTFPELANLEIPQTTPDGLTQMGYRGLVVTNVNATLYNIYNANDYALDKWIWNQHYFKPENLTVPVPRSLSRAYTWSTNTLTGYLYDYTTQVRTVTDPQESMSFVARSRTAALGTMIVGGSINTTNNFNVGSGSPVNLGDQRPDHSGEFTRPIQQLNDFYSFIYDIITKL